MIPYTKRADGVVVEKADAKLADLTGAIAPLIYPRVYIPAKALVTVTVKVGMVSTVLFSDTITPAPGKVAPFEVRVRLHPDVEALPKDPAAEIMEP